ncbi:hypothetical protein [Deinococcus yavapaiensis]|uniref:DUF3558 domain-containing protein n=1 Tax=Deinococcus yavapaiensis KR-236 TaxID=694435 RepID=A0A318SJ01_9DEIO|nr:hypothetical protein [Deinococcus yavapaiensis]PYE54165.1 hypothetical protein DES52_106130 [Deinococcus yavapaiensis KR-236]
MHILSPVCHTRFFSAALLLSLLPVASAAPTAPSFHLCQLMSPAVVKSTFAPIADGRSLEKPLEGIGGKSCSYRVPSPTAPGAPNLEQVRALIETAFFDSAGTARLALAADMDRAREGKLTNIAKLKGLGDAAFVSQQGETVSIRVIRGRMLMAVNVGKVDASFKARQDVAMSLAKQALSRLPIVK